MQVYKSHLVETGGGSGPTLDSAHANLANTFVNAFVNAGFGQVQHMMGSLAAWWLLHRAQTGSCFQRVHVLQSLSLSNTCCSLRAGQADDCDA